MKRYIPILMAALCCTFSSCEEIDTKPKDDTESVTIEISLANVTIDIDETVTVKAIDAIGGGTVDKVAWQSMDESVASVSGGVIKGISAGNTTVRAITLDGASSAECKVYVNGAQSEPEPEPELPGDIDFGGEGDIEDFH